MSQDNLTTQYISSTFQRLLQLSDNGSYVTDGTGSKVTFLDITASYVLNGTGGTGTPIGPIGSLQYNDGGGNFGGSNVLLFDAITNTLRLTGSFNISGSINFNVSSSAAITNLNYIDFNTTAAPAHLEGRVHWTDDSKTLQVDTDVNNFMIELGHQNVVRVYNPYNFDLTTGTVVYISGSQGAGRPQVATASWTGDPTSAATIGLVAQTISSTAGSKTGYVVTNGLLRNVDTTGIPVGAQLYLSASGQFTNIVPDAPNHEVRLGKVITSGPAGVIHVTIMNGYELDELHDLKTTGAAYGDLLMRSSSLWINSKQLVGDYGITGSLYITGSFGLNVNNTAPIDPPLQTGLFYFTDTDFYISLQ